VDRLFAHQPETARPSQVLVLEDLVTRVQVILTADLPTAAYRRLVALDLWSIWHGSLHYDRQRGGWRRQSDAWQRWGAAIWRRPLNAHRS
jgi:hypothetical protein